MIKNNHLYIIECKLRKFIDGEHFIYKYDSVGNLLDADGSRMIVSVGGKNKKELASGKVTYQFRDGNIKRAKK